MISIITPSLNQGEFLLETLKSIEYGGVVAREHIAVDGGSTDGTLDILRQWNSQNVDFRWISEPDDGQSHAISKGFAMAKGDILGWLNSDDYLLPGALDHVQKHFLDNPNDVLVYGEADWVDRNGCYIGPYPVLHSLGEAPSLSAFQDGCFICQPATFFRREAYMKLKGIQKNLHTAMDLDLWLQFFEAFSGRIGYCSKKLAASRLYPEIKTLSARKEVYTESMQIIYSAVGPLPVHWILSFVDEVARGKVFSFSQREWRNQLEAFCAWAIPLTLIEQRDTISHELKKDKRVALMGADWVVDIYPDGWTSDRCVLHVRLSSKDRSSIIIRGRHNAPIEFPVEITVEVEGWQKEISCGQMKRGTFNLSIPLPSGERVVQIILHVKPGFVPAEITNGQDVRRLGVLIDYIELQSRHSPSGVPFDVIT